MVQTRGQERAGLATAKGDASLQPLHKTPSSAASPTSKRKAEKSNGQSPKSPHKVKSARRSEPVEEKPSGDSSKKAVTTSLQTLLHRVLDQYGGPPLNGRVDNSWPMSKIVMAHILNALVSSARISHELAASTLACLLKEDYHDLHVLHEKTWEEKIDVLTKGGYARYRERTATFLGDLAILMEEKYDNDASKMLPENENGSETRRVLSERLKEIKGLGPLGTEVCLGSLQASFPTIAPYLDTRSKKTAKTIGLGEDLDKIFSELESDASVMAKLEVGLTKVRLGKKEEDFTTK